MPGMTFEEAVEDVGRAIEGVGIGVIVLGMLVATLRYLWALRRGADPAFRGYRQEVGKAILLGLEFLVAGDIIRTVAVDPSFSDVGILAAIVAIRTFLSFSLELELEGRWPWQRDEGAAVAPQSRGGAA